MKFSAEKSVESYHIVVKIDIGIDELMDNGVREIASNELLEAFNSDVSAKDKLALLSIISDSRK
jgi:hypothetical protein